MRETDRNTYAEVTLFNEATNTDKYVFKKGQSA